MAEAFDTGGGQDVPTFRYEIIKARKLPKVDAKLRRVTTDTNVVGRPPIRILHLCVFDNPPGFRTTSTVRGENSICPFAQACPIPNAQGTRHSRSRCGIDALIADTADEVDVAIREFVYVPDQKRLKRFKTEVERGTSTWDRYGGYSVNSMLSHDEVWR